MEKKKDIRKRVLYLRNNICKEEWEEKSHKIYEKVVTHPFFLNANTIYCYVDYRNEVGTEWVIKKAWDLHKQVAVPKVEGEEMKFYIISSFDDLYEGYRGIQEPVNQVLANDENALIILPGVAFDRNRNRIGYGKGFYDRFLDKHPFCKTIAIGFACQIVDEIQTDSFDYRPDILITEECIYDESFAK